MESGTVLTREILLLGEGNANLAFHDEIRMTAMEKVRS